MRACQGCPVLHALTAFTLVGFSLVGGLAPHDMLSNYLNFLAKRPNVSLLISLRLVSPAVNPPSHDRSALQIFINP